MKTLFPCWIYAGAVLAVGAGSGAHAATATVVIVKPDPVLAAQSLANYRVGLSSAKVLAKADNLPAAEAALTPLNTTKPNTAEWQIETAQRLVQLAEQLAREGQPRSVASLANNALQHLAQADTLATDARTRAAAKSLAGFIHERFLANRTAAIASYQSAAAISPSTALTATEAATRLQKTDDTLKARNGGK